MVSVAFIAEPPSISELDDLCASDCSANHLVDGLEAYALRSRAVQHPLLAAIGQGQFDDLAGAIRRLLAHQHFAAMDGDVEYLTATNKPMLHAIGQTVLREEKEPSPR